MEERRAGVQPDKGREHPCPPLVHGMPKMDHRLVAADERHGSARQLFTLWFGANLNVLTIVTGVLATTINVTVK